MSTNTIEQNRETASSASNESKRAVHCDRRRWRDVVNALTIRQYNLTAQEWQALIEGWFRLAVHPDTHLAEAIVLLQRCVRRDGSNPRYAYHLARIFYKNNQMEQAAQWLEHACRLCPTSHRLWSHACVLHWELDQRYRDPTKYELQLFPRRAKAIIEKLRNGDDIDNPDLIDFKPKESLAAIEARSRTLAQAPHATTDAETIASPGEQRAVHATHAAKDRSTYFAGTRAQRLLNPGVLRWSGIRDLALENSLEGQPRQGLVLELSTTLQQIAGEIRSRRGGIAAFCISAVQWLVAGYPVSTVRRIIEQCSLTEHEKRLPSVVLLERVCHIYEAETAHAMEQLWAAARASTVPPLALALIHRRRILWQSLKYQGISQYRQAWSFLSETRSPEDKKYPQQLQTAASDAVRLEKLLAQLQPTMPTGLSDAVPQARSKAGLDTHTALTWLTKLEQVAATVATLRNEFSSYLVASILPGLKQPDQFAVAATDSRAAAQWFESLTKTCTSALELLKQAEATLLDGDRSSLPDDIGARKEACQLSLNDSAKPGTFARNLKKAASIVDAGSDERAGAPSSSVVAWIAQLDSVVLPKPDAQGSSTLEIPEEVLAKLEVSVAALTEVKEGLLNLLRSKIQPASACEDLAMRAVAKTEMRLIHQIVESLTTTQQLGAKKLEQLMEQLQTADRNSAPKDIGPRRETLQAQLASLSSLGTAKRTISKVDSNLASIDLTEQLASAVASTEVIELHARAQAIVMSMTESPAINISENAEAGDESSATSSTSSPSSNDKEVPQSLVEPIPSDLPPFDRLRFALERTDRRIDQLFDEAEATFRGYPSWFKTLPSLRDLYTAVRERRAELLYRLGRRREARRQWAAILRDDRAHVSACKNLAVCDALSAHAGDSLASWRLYAESLYAQTARSKNVRSLSTARVELHRSIGLALAPRFIASRMDAEWIKKIAPEQALAFVANGWRVTSFINQVMLEFLSLQLRYDSPSLVLGIASDEIESAELRNQAVKTLNGFASEACRALPEHFGKQFADLVDATMQAAIVQAKPKPETPAQRKARQGKYAEERDAHLKLLGDFIELKFKLFRMVVHDREFVTRMATIDFLDQLRRLDQLPLTTSDQFAMPLAAQWSMTPDQLQNLMSVLSQRMCELLLEFLFEDAKNSVDRQQQQDQYERLVTQWIHRPAFEDMKPVLAIPSRCYPTDLHEALNLISTDGVTPELIARLRVFHERYPALTGVAHDLAYLFQRIEKFEEALPVLERSADEAYDETGRKGCRQAATQIRVKLAFDEENFAEARQLLLKVVDENCEHSSNAYNLIIATTALAIRSEQESLIGDLRKEIDSWRQRAEQFIADWKLTASSTECPIDNAQIDEVISTMGPAIRRAELAFAQSHFNAAIGAANKRSFEEMDSYLAVASDKCGEILKHAIPREEVDTISRSQDLLKSIRETIVEIQKIR